MELSPGCSSGEHSRKAQERTRPDTKVGTSSVYATGMAGTDRTGKKDLLRKARTSPVIDSDNIAGCTYTRDKSLYISKDRSGERYC